MLMNTAIVFDCEFLFLEGSRIGFGAPLTTLIP
jgi:hypothetical protein